MSAPHCDNEEGRIRALYRYEILDTEPEPFFDDITRLLAYVCKTPISLISFVDRERQWFKSEFGLKRRQTPREVSFCAYAILQPELYVVPDTHLNPDLMQNPLVVNYPGIRFYAGAPIITPDGFALGTVNVIDFTPRNLSEEQRDTLMFMARQVMAHMELRYALSQKNAAEREREHLLEESIDARREAERVNKMKDRFLAMLSHELRTPLNAMLGWVQLMQKMRPAPPPRCLEGLSVIERNARLQAGLIEGLLDLNRIISGKLKLERAELALVEVTDAVLNTLSPLFAEKHLKLARPKTDPHLTVLGDNGRIQQILWNLISNAIKFTPEGGTITVSIYSTEDGEACVEVSDTGKGIEQSALPHIFERFHQAEETSIRSAGGLGIGLAIAKELVEAHGGRVAATSEGLEKGSSFFALFPALKKGRMKASSQMALTPRRETTQIPHRPLTNLLVLAVDDEGDARELMRVILEEHGARVLTAKSAQEALKIFSNAHLDLIVSDIAMPGEDGYFLMQHIRAKNDGPPAIALTAFAGEEDRQRAFEVGYQSHLAKPFEASILVERAYMLTREKPSK